MRVLVVGIAIIAAVSGCARNISPNSYSVGSVGQLNRTVSATVISVRSVDVAGTTGTGTGVGAGAGAVAGSGLAGNTRGSIVGAIGGAVVGGIAGAVIESNATYQKGLEYVVETENGNLMTVVQGTEPHIDVGRKVLVLYGFPSRLIQDPRR